MPHRFFLYRHYECDNRFVNIILNKVAWFICTIPVWRRLYVTPMNGVRDKLLWTFPQSWTNSVMVEPTLCRLVAPLSSCLNFMLHHQMLHDFCLTHWDRNIMVIILQTTFSNAFYWIQIGVFWLKSHWNLFPRPNWQDVRLWLGQSAGTAKVRSHYLN